MTSCFTLYLKKNTWVLAHPAILCHGVHLHLPGTTDELGDDHWVLLDDKQQQIFNSVDRSRMQYLILNFNCSVFK